MICSSSWAKLPCQTASVKLVNHSGQQVLCWPDILVMDQNCVYLYHSTDWYLAQLIDILRFTTTCKDAFDGITFEGHLSIDT